MNVTRYRCSVLVVDDEPNILALLAAQLGDEFEVVTACSAEQARALFAQRSVDIVLSDLQLPGESGLSLLDWVRRTAPRTARILMSGTVRLEDATDAINQSQVHRIVLKPWRREDLLQTLRAVSRTLLLERSHEQLLDELRRLNMELEQRVADRTRELEAALAKLQEVALTDSLTGLANLRSVEMTVEKEVRRRMRNPSPIALAMIDADHFKNINTRYLHTGGNHVLVWLAGVLRNSVRASDSLARVGGEEFLVVAPDTDAGGAAVLAERLRSAVDAAATQYDGHPIRMTISLGVAVADAATVVSYPQLFKCAAEALKEAKDSGRNRAVVRQYDPPAVA
ncbi:MAG TPA: diguanylate cyclase [Gemmata sp.]|nr:diguanylate cyclase [Gemmata sp.]